MQDLSLTRIEAVRVAIEAASTVQEIKETLDAATAMKIYAEQQRLGKEIEGKMAEYVVRSERKLGEIIRRAKEAGQIKEGNPKFTTIADDDSCSFTLKEAGISLNLSSRAQKIEAIPQEAFEKKVTELKESGKLSANAVVRSKHQVNGKKSDNAPKPHPRHDEVVACHDNGLNNSQIADELGIGKRQVRHIVDDEKKIRAAVNEIEPTITPNMLSMTAQQKLDLAIKQHKAKLDAEWRAALNARVKEFLEDTIGPSLQREQDQARYFMKSRTGIMDRKTYRKIWACLHPDRISDPEMKPLYTEAFHLFTAAEKLLLSETNSPTEYVGIPKTAAEWDELKRQATEARKAKRTGGSGIQATR